MRCRLMLDTPPDLLAGGVSLESFARSFEAALAGGDVAAALLRVGTAEESEIARLVVAVKPAAGKHAVALLLEGRSDLAMALGCDGVELAAEPGSLRAVRRAIGQDMILGADCGSSRHLAMLAGEIGCDYVVFSASEGETIAWWAELMEVPLVARGAITLENVPELVETGADFLAVESAVWTHKRGPAAAVAAFNKLMAAASR